MNSPAEAGEGGAMYYVVLQLNKEIQVSFMGREFDMPLSYAKGMIGALPAFESREAAEEFAGANYEIYEITIRDQQP